MNSIDLDKDKILKELKEELVGITGDLNRIDNEIMEKIDTCSSIGECEIEDFLKNKDYAYTYAWLEDGEHLEIVVEFKILNLNTEEKIDKYNFYNIDVEIINLYFV